MAIVKAGSEFQVHQTTIGHQGNSSIAVDAKDNFVIVWDAEFFDGDGFGVVARQFKAKGTPKGNEIAVNTFTTDYQRTADVAVDAKGNFVVTWRNDLGRFENRFNDVSARRFAQNGNAIDLTDILSVNTYTTGNQSSTQIAMTDKGRYVITWQSQGQDGSERGIYAQRFNAKGVPQGPEMAVNTFTEGDQSDPAIAMHQDGSFIITWTSWAQDGFGGGIYAQRFDAKGKPQGKEFQVNVTTEGYEHGSAVAMTVDGNFIVTWEGNGKSQDGSDDIFARLFKANGKPLTDEFIVHSFQAGDQENSAIAVDRQGNFVVTWESNGQSGDDTYDVYARRFRADGTPWGKEFQVNTFTAGEQWRPAIAMQRQGDFLITWDSVGQDGDAGGIFAQRFALASTIAFDKTQIKVREGQQAKLILNRLDESHLRAKVSLEVVGGTATAGEDYLFGKSLNVTFKPGETRKTIKVPILQDSFIEKKETIFLEISAGNSPEAALRNRAYLDQDTKAKIIILDATSKGDRPQTDDPLLGRNTALTHLGEMNRQHSRRQSQLANGKPFSSPVAFEPQGQRVVNSLEQFLPFDAQLGSGQGIALSDSKPFSTATDRPWDQNFSSDAAFSMAPALAG